MGISCITNSPLSASPPAPRNARRRQADNIALFIGEPPVSCNLIYRTPRGSHANE